jgi:ATP-dependent Clp protease ATP-binding subunit ClpB
MAATHIRLDPTKSGSGTDALAQNLRRLVVGQAEAIEAILGSYQMHLSGLSAPGRPIANLLFLGPTGSGKTRIVEAMAECLLGNPHALTKVDCGEFQHAHEIAKLLGSPPGYLGHRETHPLLSQDALDRYFTADVKISFVLFDEIEKASDALWNLLLGVLDKGTLTLGDNRRVDFSRAMIFMTSNLGAAEMSAMLSPKVGFVGQTLTSETNGRLDRKIRRSAEEAARRKFTPEFINRLDKIVTFKPLGANQLREILDIELRMIQERIFHASPERSFVFTASNPAKELLLKEGTDTKYGARHLKRAIDRLLVQPISNLIATEQVRGGDCVRVDFSASQDGLNFTREMEGLGSRAMTELVGVPFPAETVAAGSPVQLEAVKTWKHAFLW